MAGGEKNGWMWRSATVRVAVAVVVGIVAYAIAMALTPWQVAELIGWDVAALTWIGGIGFTVRHHDAEATRRIATREDDSRAAADLVLISASLVSLVGVILALLKAAQDKGTAHWVIAAVAAATVVLSWATIHVVFMLRYARLYYEEDGGIDYHDDRRPAYADFAYVAFTVGMTYQVSDTDLVSPRIRHTALRHALLSYVFGTGVIATTINVVAGLLSK